MLISQTLSAQPPVPGSTCVALGLFDGLHRGHMAVLAAARELAAERGLVPAVFTFFMISAAPQSKASLSRLMSGAMFERALAGAGIERVFRPDFREFCDFSPQEFVRGVLGGALGAGAAVCGEDFRFGRGAAGDAALLRALAEAAGIPVRIVPAVTAEGGPVSSSRIRALVREGRVEEAGRLLGRPFAIDFSVMHGRELGRALGWPTINQPFPEDFTVPRHGVYASIATVDGRRYGAVSNVGVRPTVGGGDRVLAETHIRGFAGNLYGRPVPVEFLRFLRPEIKFDSLDELRGRIRRDSAQAAGISDAYLKKE